MENTARQSDLFIIVSSTVIPSLSYSLSIQDIAAARARGDLPPELPPLFAMPKRAAPKPGHNDEEHTVDDEVRVPFYAVVWTNRYV